MAIRQATLLIVAPIMTPARSWEPLLEAFDVDEAEEEEVEDEDVEEESEDEGVEERLVVVVVDDDDDDDDTDVDDLDVSVKLICRLLKSRCAVKPAAVKATVVPMSLAEPHPYW